MRFQIFTGINILYYNENKYVLFSHFLDFQLYPKIYYSYYSGLLFRKKTKIFNYPNIETKKSKELYLDKGKYNISSISRDGVLTIRDYDNNFVLSRSPEDIYGNDSLIIKFES